MGMCEKEYCFVHRQAEHQYLLCLQLSYLSILCPLSMRNAASDSLTVFTLIPYPIILWAIISEVSGWIYSFRSDILSIGYISFKIYNNEWGPRKHDKNGLARSFLLVLKKKVTLKVLTFFYLSKIERPLVFLLRRVAHTMLGIKKKSFSSLQVVCISIEFWNTFEKS